MGEGRGGGVGGEGGGGGGEGWGEAVVHTRFLSGVLYRSRIFY